MDSSIVPRALARQPWGVVVALSALVLFGAAVLYSAAGGSLRPWALTHVLRFCVFLVLAFAISRLSPQAFRTAAFPVYLAITGLLVLVDAVGAIGGGSRRWLDLGVLTLQPSELMKPGIILVLARFYELLPATESQGWRSIVPAAGIAALPVGLVLLQPDLGTGLAIAFGAAAVMFLAGLPLRWFLGAALAAGIAAPLAYFTLLHDYQRRRVTTFLDPESDPLGAGYHITQSKIAIGSGGVFGKGFGQGSQSHLDYLPEPHTDFVFATMAEEWGVAGGLFVLLLFAVLLRWGLKVALAAPDRFSRLLAAGMTVTIFFYVAINLMMVTGLAPVVGIPLPFMSHGGSSMLTNMICISAIMAVERWSARHPGGGGLS